MTDDGRASDREMALAVLRAWLDHPTKRGQIPRLAGGERVFDADLMAWVTPDVLRLWCGLARVSVSVSWAVAEARRRDEMARKERAA